MNKTELVTSLSEKSGLTKKNAELALKAFVDTIEEALEKKEKVQLISFGSWEVRHREERIGIKPGTKEEILIPERDVPVFTAGKKFKEKINK